jgi:hypothetical protein
MLMASPCTTPTEPAAPSSLPLAVGPSNLSVAEVVTLLAEILCIHPDACSTPTDEPAGDLAIAGHREVRIHRRTARVAVLLLTLVGWFVCMLPIVADAGYFGGVLRFSAFWVPDLLV